MLEPLSISTAVDFAQELNTKGLRLTCIPDTPMHMLLRTTPIGEIKGDLSYSDLSSHLLDLSRNEDHAQICQEVKQLASQAVRRTLDFTRNVVLPHIRAAREDYNNRMRANDIAPLPYFVDVRYLPEVYRSQYSRELVERWEDQPSAGSAVAANLGTYGHDEILQLSKVSAGDGFNDSMSDLLSSENNQGFRQIGEVLSGLRAVDKIDPRYSLPLMIVLSNIEEPKPGVEMTLGQYNLRRTEMLNNAARVALNIMKRRDVSLKHLSLYETPFDESSKTIVVNGEINHRLVEENGLTVEHLIANELIGRRYTAQSLMKPEVQEELDRVYARDKVIRQAAHQMNRKAEGRRVLMDVLRDDQKRIAQSGAFIVEGDNAERSWIRLRDLVDTVLSGPHREADPTLMLSAIICGAWYAHTDAARFIDIMFDIEREYPDLSSEEISRLATLRYIACWVKSQIVVTKTSPSTSVI